MTTGILLLVLLVTAGQAQTRWPSPLRFSYKGDTTRLDTHSDFLPDRTFRVGWHWGASPHIGRATSANQIHVYLDEFGRLHKGWYGDTGQYCSDNARMIMNLYPFHGQPGQCYVYNIGMLWEPTYRVDSLDPTGRFHPRPGDTLGYAFGFRHVRGVIPLLPSHPHYSRLLLFPSLFPATGDTLVLANPWMDNTIAPTSNTLLLPDTTSQANLIVYSRHCRKLFLSVSPLECFP